MDLDQRYPAVSDLRARAKRRVPHFVFEYLDSATGVEDQHRRNMEALRAVRFHPAILEGPMAVDLSTTFLGRTYPLPFGCAPVGMSGIMWPGAEKILSAACAKAGIPYCMSTVATVVPETLAPHIGDQGWFQLYMPKDPGIRRDMMARAKAAGFHTLILTVDVPVDSRRERQRRANLRIPPKVDAAMLWSMLLHPEWTVGTLREGIPSLKFCEDYVDRKTGFNSVAHAGHVIRGQPGWADMDAIRAKWDGPFVVKGVTKPEDGKRLVAAGVDAIWVSNHTGAAVRRGARVARGAAADAGGAARYADRLRQRGDGGLDILRAIALGADFVMLGRAFHYSVGALPRRGRRT